MIARIFGLVRSDVDPWKARRAIPGLVFVAIAIVLLAFPVDRHYRHSKDMAATVLVLGLLLFGIYGAFAWGGPPERARLRPNDESAD